MTPERLIYLGFGLIGWAASMWLWRRRRRDWQWQHALAIGSALALGVRAAQGSPGLVWALVDFLIQAFVTLAVALGLLQLLSRVAGRLASQPNQSPPT